MTLEIVFTGGIIAAISAYMLFKIKDSDNPVVSSLQPLFFFMIMASFIIIGSASYQSTNDCQYLLNSTYDCGGCGINTNTTIYEYNYVCTETASNAGSWSYRLPLWFGYLGGSYVVIYFIYLIYKLFKGFGGREREE